MTVPRLASLDGLPETVQRPGYDRERHGVGIVHIGIGAFHRAHQAVFTDDALAAEGGDWRVAGVSLRSEEAADALNPQRGLYTLLVRDGAGTNARIIGALDRVIAARRDAAATPGMLADPAVRVVTLTVTEKAYGIERASGTVARDHPAIAADLAAPRTPSGVVGLLVEGLRRRRADGIAPFTIVCCDNLPENGGLLRAGVVDFAALADDDLGRWIAGEVAFPSTMVDRITPAPTEATRADAARLTGHADHAAIETEPFSQWVVEDRFPAGRPAWEAGGALLVSDVAPYETMKLRMLNGAHSMLAYVGHVAGYRYVRDAMADAAVRAAVQRHFATAAATLEPVPGIDLDDYAEALVARFENPAIAHQTYQIAMDGTEKLPQRLLAPARDALAAGQDITPFAFAVAAWMRYCLGRTDVGERYALRDPREDEIRAALEGAGGAPEAIAGALHALPGLFPTDLVEHPAWRRAVIGELNSMLG